MKTFQILLVGAILFFCSSFFLLTITPCSAQSQPSIEITPNAIEHTVVVPYEKSFLFIANIKNKGAQTEEISVFNEVPQDWQKPGKWQKLAADGRYRLEPGQEINYIIVFEPPTGPDSVHAISNFTVPVSFFRGGPGGNRIIKTIKLKIQGKWLSEEESERDMTEVRFSVLDKNTNKPIQDAVILALLPTGMMKYQAEKDSSGYSLVLPSKKFIEDINQQYQIDHSNKGYFLQVLARGYKGYFEANFLPEEGISKTIYLEPLNKVGEYQEIKTIKSGYSIWWIRASSDSDEQFFAFSHGCHCSPENPPPDSPTMVTLTDRKGNVLWQKETEGECWGLDISPAGDYIAAGCAEGTIYLWNREGNLLWQYQNKGKGMKGPSGTKEPPPASHPSRWVKFSPDSKYLISGPVDGQSEVVALFETTSGEIIWKFRTEAHLREARFSRDGQTVYLGSSNGALYAVDVKTGKAKWLGSGDYYLPFILSIIESKNMAIAAGKGRAFVALNLSDGTRLWKRVVEQTVTAGNADDDGSVLGNTVGGMLYRLNADGEFIWTRFYGGCGHNGAQLTQNGQYALLGGPNPTLFDKDGNVLWQREKDKKVEMEGPGEVNTGGANEVWLSEDASLLILGLDNGDIVFYEGAVKEGKNDYSQLTGPSEVGEATKPTGLTKEKLKGLTKELPLIYILAAGILVFLILLLIFWKKSKKVK